MTNLLSISLDRLRFRAYHGLYPEEKKTGNEFEVDLTIAYQPSSGIITGISDTVNYESLYALLRSEMQKPRDLLETFAMEFVELVHQAFPQVMKIEITITKLQPPIAGFTGQVSVKYSKQY